MKKVILLAVIAFVALASAQAQEFPGLDTLHVKQYESHSVDTTVIVEKTIMYRSPQIRVSFDFMINQVAVDDSMILQNESKSVRIYQNELSKNVTLKYGGQSYTKTALQWLAEMQTNEHADLISRELHKVVYNKKVAGITQ